MTEFVPGTQETEEDFEENNRKARADAAKSAQQIEAQPKQGGIKGFIKQKYGEFKEERAEKQKLRKIYKTEHRQRFTVARREAAMHAGRRNAGIRAAAEVRQMFPRPTRIVYSEGRFQRRMVGTRVKRSPFDVASLGGLGPVYAPGRKKGRAARQRRFNLADVL